MTPSSPSPPAGSGPDRQEARALARARAAELRRRGARIRRSVIALALGLFTAAFLVVYVQLASGHDPALVAAAQRRHHLQSRRSTRSPSGGTGEATASPSQSTSTELGSESSSGESGSEPGAGESGGTQEGSGESPSSVTTSQS